MSLMLTEFIKLRVVGSDGSEIHFRVKKTTLLGKMKVTYSERVGVPFNYVTFFYEGRRINDDETPRYWRTTTLPFPFLFSIPFAVPFCRPL